MKHEARTKFFVIFVLCVSALALSGCVLATVRTLKEDEAAKAGSAKRERTDVALRHLTHDEEGGPDTRCIHPHKHGTCEHHGAQQPMPDLNVAVPVVPGDPAQKYPDQDRNPHGHKPHGQ